MFQLDGTILLSMLKFLRKLPPTFRTDKCRFKIFRIDFWFETDNAFGTVEIKNQKLQKTNTSTKEEVHEGYRQCESKGRVRQNHNRYQSFIFFITERSEGTAY